MKLKSLYLHFPFCRHLCNYCDFHKSVLAGDEQILSLNEKLALSFEAHQKFLEKHQYCMNELDTFYIGGGTPSLWDVKGAQFLKDMFFKYEINIPKNREYTLEVNPGAWTKDGLTSFMDFGVNRFSLGIQSLDSRFIKYLDRIHSLEDVHTTLEYFNNHKLHFSVDFMLGLPFSKEYDRDIIFELKEILKYNPEHLSLYILTTKDNYIHKAYLPDEDFIADEFNLVADFLKSHGYDHYEVSNFSKNGFESKHNLMYWKSEGVGAIGPSATGLLPESKIRYKWKNLSNEMMLEKLTDDELALEKFYMRLRTNQGMDLSSTKPYFVKLKDIVNEWEEKGFGQNSEGVFKTSSLGFLMIDSMMDDIFRKI